MNEIVERAVGRHPFHPGGADDLVKRLDREGISRAWVLSEAYIAAAEVWKVADANEERSLVSHENDFLANQTARFSDRLIPFLSVNPKRDYALEEIDRCVERHGIRGLKLHCWNSLVDVRDATDLARLRAVLECAASHRLPVVVHAFNGGIRGYGEQDIEIWARDLVLPISELQICFAHLGGAGGFAPPVQRVFSALVARLGPNSPAANRVNVDISAVLMGDNGLGIPPTPAEHKQGMAELLRDWGCDRVLWGSDSIPGYLEQSRGAWPLDDEAWRTVCRHRGRVPIRGVGNGPEGEPPTRSR